MAKIKKPIPANLSNKQKEDMKKAILAQFPNLEMMGNIIEELIDQYNLDKNYIKKLNEKCATPNTEQERLELRKQELKKHLESVEILPMQVLKCGTPAWQEIIDKMQKSREDAYKLEDAPEEEKVNITNIEVTDMPDKEVSNI